MFASPGGVEYSRRRVSLSVPALAGCGRA
jgi:hypothetical protein